MTRNVDSKIRKNQRRKHDLSELERVSGHRHKTAGTLAGKFTKPRNTSSRIDGRPPRNREGKITQPRISKCKDASTKLCNQRSKPLWQKLQMLCKPNGLSNYQHRRKVSRNNFIVRRREHRAPISRKGRCCTNPLKLSEEQPETFFSRLKS